MPQKPARKKDPHGDKGKESQARHGFYKLVMVLLPSPPAEDMYCEGNSTNNHVAFAPAVSKCCLRSFKRLLNFSIPHCHRDRKDDFTELFLKEKYLGCVFHFLAPATGCLSQRVQSVKNVSVIYLITLKLGTDLFAVTMFVELGAARLSPTVACWMCMKLQTSCL